MWKLFREAWKEAKKRKAEEELKSRFLEKKIDYQYLEELIQQINENPSLRVSITLKDGTLIEMNTQPRKKQLLIAEQEDFLEVK